ncbi:S8 family serine peptidase [Streptomyces sp. JJ36]|nr:S8 family serine peptidase [Streptomyces sp. JJ36]
MRRSLLCLLALTGAWSLSVAAAMPAAVAADVRSQQWYLEAMQAEKMWQVSTGEGIKVAVIDTGVDPSTPSLQGQVLPGKDVSDKAGDENDDYDSHGTTVAELIVGTGKGGGVQGLAPGAKVIPFRTSLTREKKLTEQSDLYKAIRAAADSDAKVINMSLGGDITGAHAKEAVEYAASKGKLMFAATGNDGDGKNPIEYPAAYPEVVGVGALTKSASAANFSGHGWHVSLSAPGVSMPAWCDKSLTEYCPDKYGTSLATALASASAALIWSEHPDWTANQVLRVMLETAAKPKDGKVPSTKVGYGGVRPRLNLLEGKGDPGDPDKSPLPMVGAGEEQGKPSASPGGGDGDAADDGAAGKDDAAADTGAEDKENVADSSSAEGDGNTLWIVIGAGVAVAAAAGGAVAVARSRSR